MHEYGACMDEQIDAVVDTHLEKGYWTFVQCLKLSDLGMLAGWLRQARGSAGTGRREHPKLKRRT